jgi:hypothetical protein
MGSAGGRGGAPSSELSCIAMVMALSSSLPLFLFLCTTQSPVFLNLRECPSQASKENPKICREGFSGFLGFLVRV